MQKNTFEYIIAGGGMAGLSLAFYLNESEILRDKKILIIDRDQKNTNDHTWCFWEQENSAFDQVVFRYWDRFWFHGTQDFDKLLLLEKYRYKMIRAIDFYKFAFSKINKNPNIRFLQTDITAVENDSVKTVHGKFFADEFIFDSFTRKTYDNPKYHNLWQHFLGWEIEASEAIFDVNEPTLFDFRVEQKNECRFIYILPISTKKALIEFTIFSDNLLEQEEYETNLRKYIAEILKIEKYKINETESGVIPMSDEPHEQFPGAKIIRIGTAGGYVKPSTGYSFKRTQKRLQKLVENLAGNHARKTENRFWKSCLDSILLNVMQTKKHSVDDVFTYLFKYNKTSRVLKFLDEDTSFAEDLLIMRSVPTMPFTIAAAEILSSKNK